MSALGDELVRHCWHLLHSGQPYRALLIAERALRIYQPPADSVLSGRLSLIVGVALAALGRGDPARRYLEDASWSLAHASDREDLPPPGETAGATRTSSVGDASG
jgi:hypothetical protein